MNCILRSISIYQLLRAAQKIMHLLLMWVQKCKLVQTEFLKGFFFFLLIERVFCTHRMSKQQMVLIFTQAQVKLQKILMVILNPYNSALNFFSFYLFSLINGSFLKINYHLKIHFLNYIDSALYLFLIQESLAC